MFGRIPYLLGLRACVLCVVAVRFALPLSQRAGSIGHISAMFVAMLVLLGVLVALWRRRERIQWNTYQSMMAASVIADVVLITWAYTLTGKLTSDFFLFYYLPILTAAEYLSLSEIGLAIMLALAGLGIGLLLLSTATPPARAGGDHKGFDVIAMWVTRGGFLMLFALVSILRTRFQRAESGRLQRLLEVQRMALEDFHAADLSERMVEWLLHMLTEEFDFDFAAISVINRHASTISMIRAQNVELGWMRNTHYRLTDRDILTDIVRRRKAEVLVGEDPRFNPKTYSEYGHGKLARIFAPMMCEGEVVGVLETGCTRDRETYVREQFKHVTLLAELMGGPVSMTSTDNTLTKVAERAREAGQADGAAILLLEEGSVTHAVSTDGIPTADLVRQGDDGKEDFGVCSKYDISPEAVVDGMELARDHRQLFDQGIRSIAAFRIVSTERTSGVLYLCFGRERPTLREADREVLRGIANVMGGVIVDRLLLNEATSNARLAWMVAHQQPVLQSLVGEREHQVVLRDLVESIQRTMAADSVVLYPYVSEDDRFLDPVSAGVKTSG